MAKTQHIVNDGTRSGEFLIHDVDCASACAPAVMDPQPIINGIIICIYKITSPTGRIYIGMTTNLVKRWRFYKNSSAIGQPLLNNSLKKHGWNNHKKEVVAICLESELKSLEVFYIKAFKSFGTPQGMNLTSGGDKPTFSDDAKKRMSESHKGKPTWNKGLTNIYNEQTLHEMGSGRRGKPGTFAGKNHSKESCANMSASQMGNTNGLGEIRSPEVGRKISAKLRGRIPHNRKPINQLDLSGRGLKQWESIAAAELQFPDKSRNITCCLRGKQKTAYGFKWKYAPIDAKAA